MIQNTVSIWKLYSMVCWDDDEQQQQQQYNRREQQGRQQ